MHLLSEMVRALRLVPASAARAGMYPCSRTVQPYARHRIITLTFVQICKRSISVCHTFRSIGSIVLFIEGLKEAAKETIGTKEISEMRFPLFRAFSTLILRDTVKSAK